MVDKTVLEKAEKVLHSFMDKPVAEFDVTKPYAILVKRNGPVLFKDKEETLIHLEAFQYPKLHEEFKFNEAIFEFLTYHYSILFCEPEGDNSKFNGTDALGIVSELLGTVYVNQCESLFECYRQLYNEEREYYFEYRYLNPEFQECFREEIGKSTFGVSIFNVEPENALTIIKCLQTINFFKIAEDLKNNTGEEVSSREDVRTAIDKLYAEMAGKVPLKYNDDEWTEMYRDEIKDAMSYGTIYGIDFYNDFLNYYYTNLPCWREKSVKEIDKFDEEYIMGLINNKRNPPEMEVY